MVMSRSPALIPPVDSGWGGPPPPLVLGRVAPVLDKKSAEVPPPHTQHYNVKITILVIYLEIN